MIKTSVLIPSCNERFLKQTVDSLFATAAGEIEVIVMLDGPDQQWPLPEERPGLLLVHQLKRIGMRPAINCAAQLATGYFLMKLDAHCLLSDGWDDVLQKDCADNWIIIPPRYSLDPVNWCIEKNGKMRRDYHYLSSPIGGLLKRGDYTMHGVEWWERCKARVNKPEYDLDETMSGQGSCWFMSREHWDRLGGYHPEAGYGLFINELQEIGNETWCLGGALMTNKRCWYAHLHKGHQWGRMYHLDQTESRNGQLFCSDFWLHDRWKQPDKVRSFESMIDHFWPVPDWPDNWKALNASGFGPDTFKFVAKKIEEPE